jgi:hypothetical protein
MYAVREKDATRRPHDAEDSTHISRRKCRWVFTTALLLLVDIFHSGADCTASVIPSRPTAFVLLLLPLPGLCWRAYNRDKALIEQQYQSMIAGNSTY